MKIAVIGNRGMLGQDLLTRLNVEAFAVTGLDLPELDMTMPEEVQSHLTAIGPDLVINCAAYTAVDKAESEQDTAFAVNRDGTVHLADTCASLHVPLIHISTDYIFDGLAKQPYLEDDPANPMGVYGLSKWQGEEAVRCRLTEHLIVRTAWLFGVHGANFVKTILRLARKQEELKVIADQHGCPTWTGDLAQALVTMVDSIRANRQAVQWGTYHFCGAGRTTWHGFSQAIVEEASKRETLQTVRVVHLSTSDYPTAAKRPMWSVLDCEKILKIFQISPMPWQKALGAMLDELYEAEPETTS